jgi:hypothetical protein
MVEFELVGVVDAEGVLLALAEALHLLGEAAHCFGKFVL